MQNTNFEVVQGDTWQIDIYYEDVDGNPINISTYNIVAEVRNKPGGEIFCAASDMSDGISLINFPNISNAIRITFSPEKTAKFNLPKSAYQIKIVETGDTLAMGWLNVEPGVINA